LHQRSVRLERESIAEAQGIGIVEVGIQAYAGEQCIVDWFGSTHLRASLEGTNDELPSLLAGLRVISGFRGGMPAGHLAKDLKSLLPEVLGISDDALEFRVVH
jgi:hypothetical protein